MLAATLEDPRLVAAFGGDRFDAPADDIPRAVGMLVESYERAGDATVRLLALESRLPSVADLLAFGRVSHREWVQRTFPAALAGLSPARRERRAVLLISATDVYTWKLLRRDQGLTQRQAAEAIGELVEALHANTDAGRSSRRVDASGTAGAAARRSR